MAAMRTLWLSLAGLMQVSILMAFPVRYSGQPSSADLEFAQGYLEKFYGFRPPSGRQRRTAESDVFRDKVRAMQRFFGLEESGDLTPQTMATMRKPRCGLSDAEPFGETMRWRNRTLTYRISSYITAIRPSRIRRILRAAWQLWGQVAPIAFRHRSRREADIVISFNHRDHDDGSPFDGEGGILAHAFFPGPGIGGDVHFDSEEDWTTNGTGYSLYAVAAHEFGHALGLPHSDDPGAIMFPAYNFVTEADIQLSFKDVKDIQEMYDVHPNFSSMRPPPKTPDNCDPGLSFDAVTRMRQELVFFKDRFMWRWHPNFDKITVTLIASLWPDIPSFIDAAYENEDKNVILFFKGSQYWVVKGLDLQAGFPRNISDFGFPTRAKAIDAVLHFREARMTEFFIGSECWRYDEQKMRVMEGYPKPIAHQWPGILPPLDAAVFNEGVIYFFMGNLQLEYDSKLKIVTKKMYANRWLQCR